MVENGTNNELTSNRIAAVVTQVLGPALAIAVVGSIAFFLIDISYSGPLVGRCKWIFSLFCFAAVLVSRISIQEGYHHAAVYGLLLAFATLLVSAQFMQGNIIWLGLILGFVWWCAGRLTWDCTFIDATRDASGQGMIDLAIDRATNHRNETLAEKVTSEGIADVGSKRLGSESIRGRINRIFFRRRQPNTPGLWAFYFLIGGLPFFGIGQMLIPMRDSARHHSVSMQLLVYFIGVLGLLMISSVTGLHRYLQKNDSSLPTRIAVRWLITGTVMALLIALVSWLLPRPSPQYSIAGLIPRLTSFNLNASRSSMGKDGQKQSDQNSNLDSGPQGENRESNEKNSKQGTSGIQKTDQNGNPVDKQGASQGGGKYEGNSKGGGKKSEGSQSSSGKQDGQSNNPPKDGDSGKSEQSDSGKNKDDISGKNENKSGDSKSDSGDDKSNKSDPGDETKQGESSRDKQDSKQKDGRLAPREPQRSNQDSGRQQGEKGDQEGSQDKQDEQGQSGGSASESQSSVPREQSGSLANGIGKLAKLLIWIVVAIIVVWFVFKNRSRLLPWFSSFIQELIDFWNRLFHRTASPDATARVIAETVRHETEAAMPGFQQFRNPFISGDANQWSAERVVRYTYEAFEAWSRDQRCSREPEQTVLEFAHSTGQRYRSLASDVLQLATLYSQIAYAGATVSQPAAMTLSELWDKLSSLYRSGS